MTPVGLLPAGSTLSHFDLRGPLPTRVHRARGQRRHRQDLLAGRSGRPLRRRGGPRGVRAVRGQLHRGGHRRATGPHPVAAGRGPRPPGPGRTGRRRDRRPGPRGGRPPIPRSASSVASGSSGPWPTSTPPPSPPSTASARGWSPPAAAIDLPDLGRRLRRRRAGRRPRPGPLRRDRASGRPSRGKVAEAVRLRLRMPDAQHVQPRPRGGPGPVGRPGRPGRRHGRDRRPGRRRRRRRAAAPGRSCGGAPSTASSPTPVTCWPARVARRSAPLLQAAVPAGDDRRVPGHRPGPVGHLPRRLPRGRAARHRGGRRRPEAVDLPVPVGRAVGLPRRPRPGRRGHQPRHQPALRRPAARRPRDSCSPATSSAIREVAFQSVRRRPGPRADRPRSSRCRAAPAPRPRRRRSPTGEAAAPGRATTWSPRSCACSRLPCSTTPTRRAARRRLRASDIGVLVRSNADATRYVAALAAARGARGQLLQRQRARQSRPPSSGASCSPPSSGRRRRARARAAGTRLVRGHDRGRARRHGRRRPRRPGRAAPGLGRWRWSRAGWPRLMAAGPGHGPARAGAAPARRRARPHRPRPRAGAHAGVGRRPTGRARRPCSAVLDDLADPDLTDEEALAPELLSRRIDRDDDTVKVLTVHRAKGLEFPVVLCPTLWTAAAQPPGPRRTPTLDGGRLIDTNCMRLPAKPAAGGKRFIDDRRAPTRSSGPGRTAACSTSPSPGPSTAWWCGGRRCAVTKSTLPPLGELFVHAGGGSLDPPALAARSQGAIDVVEVGPPGDAPDAEPCLGAPRARLDVAVARRALDDRWRIWSFSAMKAAADAAAQSAGAVPAGPGASDVPAMGGVDEPSVEATTVTADGRRRCGVAPPRRRPPAVGAGRHRVRHPGARRARAGRLRRPRSSSTSSASTATTCSPTGACRSTADELADGSGRLTGAPRSAGPWASARAGRPRAGATVSTSSSFDLPLAALRRRRARRGRRPPPARRTTSWRRGSSEAAVEGLAVDVDGLLTGSIDLVGRTADGRYWLADYKTNLLPDGDYGPRRPGRGHGPPRLPAAGHALPRRPAPLPAVAGARLRPRPPPRRRRLPVPPGHATPIGSTAARPTPGIVWWRPPTAAIRELDRLLATGRAA